MTQACTVVHMVLNRTNVHWAHMLQSTVGTLVAKTLTTASSNPYAANPTTRTGAPAALDAFSIQVRAVMTIGLCWLLTIRKVLQGL